MCLYNFPEVVIFIVYEALASNIEFSLDFIMNKYLFRMVGDEPGFFFFFFFLLNYTMSLLQVVTGLGKPREYLAVGSLFP